MPLSRDDKAALERATDTELTLLLEQMMNPYRASREEATAILRRSCERVTREPRDG